MNQTAVVAVLFEILALGLAGCSSQAPESSPVSDHPLDGQHDHSDQARTDMEKMKAELAKLSPEDAASAEKQHVCPVSGEMLGKMGAPKKVDVNGQQVWICCDGCRDQLLASPQEYLAKLKKD